MIIQNNIGNKYSPTTIISSLTLKGDKSFLFLVKVDKGIANLPKDSFIQLNQLRTISKERIINKIGFLPKDIMQEVDFALKKSLALE